MIALLVLLVLLLALSLYAMTAYNRLVRARNTVKNAFHQVDVQLKRRHDLIPNLVEVVKEAMSYEKETLEKVIQARNMAVGAQSMREKAQQENMLTSALKSLFAVVENYPELKANQNVMQLQGELTGTENKLAHARRFYNDCVLAFNNLCDVIPTNIIAGMFNFKKADYFEAPDEEKQVPKVSF